MKVRESGMPAQETWEAFFDPPRLFGALGLVPTADDVLEFGCGYGTFTLPAAQLTQGTVYALDIEPAMVAATEQRARGAGLANVRAEARDFLVAGSGRPEGSVGFAMLFNILHLEEPEALLREAWRSLRAGGTAGVIHWRVDVATPRGPSAGIRPHPGQCRQWAEAAGFAVREVGALPGSPWHWGMVLTRT